MTHQSLGWARETSLDIAFSGQDHRSRHGFGHRVRSMFHKRRSRHVTTTRRPERHDHRITTRIDVAEYLWARSGALRAHATQVDPNETWWFGLDDEELAQVYPWEEWVLAVSAVGGAVDNAMEDDLFRGVA